MVQDEVRVVVIDDAVDAAEALAVALRQDGYAVRTAYDGAAAWALIETERPHCVLLDVRMPVMDGCELARRLRERYGDDIVLIAVTGLSDDDERAAESFVRVDHYLRKPIDHDELRLILPPLGPGPGR